MATNLKIAELHTYMYKEDWMMPRNLFAYITVIWRYYYLYAVQYSTTSYAWDRQWVNCSKDGDHCLNSCGQARPTSTGQLIASHCWH